MAGDDNGGGAWPRENPTDRPYNLSLMIPEPHEPEKHALHIRIIRSFYYAFAGVWFLLRTQRNARIELVIGVFACAAAAWLRVSRLDWAVLVLTVALVLILEGLNTAIECAIDLASPRIHPLAKAAKDLAAGMVLIASIASVAIGLLILGPPLWHKCIA